MTLLLCLTFVTIVAFLITGVALNLRLVLCPFGRLRVSTLLIIVFLAGAWLAVGYIDLHLL